MPRFFNTAGPVNARYHYCLPPLERIHRDDVLTLIAQHKYFVLHAPRQTGKTSSLLALQTYLNATGQYRCLYCNVEAAQAAREQVAPAMQAILSEIAGRASEFEWGQWFDAVWPEVLERSGPYAALGVMLTRLAEESPLPAILFIDEIDSLVGDTLIAVLRQIRAGYDKRPARFPQSVILCGVRDVRDYRLHTDEGKAAITGGSAFNIKAESLRLGNLNRAELESLYRQHTTETGQVFLPDALETAWQLTQGQPWLVNALAYEACFKRPAGRDRPQPISAEIIQEAKEQIILRRETHLDQLNDKLQEPRVRRVIAPILAGENTPDKLPDDDVQYVHDLGLISVRGQLRIANPIYQEVIPRALTYTTQLTINQEPAWYVAPDGQIDMENLLTAFQQFFREHSAHWVERFDYKEAGPQLLLQAFLQRILNGGGRIEREYGLGRQRTDLLVIWPYGNAVQQAVLELKIQHTSLERTIEDGLAQTWQYMDTCGTSDGHLIIFNRDPAVAWEAKIFRREAEYQGHQIVIWGM
jgi:hypothetical protein